MMPIVCYIVLGFAIMQWITIVINAIFRQTIHEQELASDETISVLIPARNEEKNIGQLLKSLRDTGEKTEILVYDDLSTDRTAAVVEEYARIDSRIRLIQGKPLPKGWLGKNHACCQLASHASGNIFLFLDADVIINNSGIIKNTASYLKRNQLELISFFPVQQLHTPAEQITVPIMNYILLSLLPLIFVRYSPFSAHSAANGQFMMFDASIYRKTNPHKQFKNNPVEDIAIARFLKKQKIKIACITAERAIQCRMYDSYSNALSGFSKNIFMFFGNIKLLAFLFWLLAFIGPIFVLLSCDTILVTIYFSIIFTKLIIFAQITKQKFTVAVLLFPVQLLFMLHVMINALCSKNNQQWKGRNISS